MSLPEAAARVQELLRELGSQAEVLEFPSGVRTVAEAAASIGVDEGQIAKSLLFMVGQEPVLVVASGRYRVDTERLRQLTGKKVRQATVDEVRSVTGYPVGGVAPLGHAQQMRLLLDQHLWDHVVIYAAAGTPQTAFAIAPDELQAITGGECVDLVER